MERYSHRDTQHFALWKTSGNSVVKYLQPKNYRNKILIIQKNLLSNRFSKNFE
jgi:hypothetical protein